MNITVVGPGALGCLFAGLFTRAGLQATLLDYLPARAGKIRKQGVVIEDGAETLTVPVPATASPRGLKPELVMVCVKAYQTELAAERLKPLVGEGTLVLTLQNGLGNAEVLQRAFGAERVLAGMTTLGATLLAPGRVRRAGRGKVYLGWSRPGEGNSERLSAVAEAMRSAGLECEAVERPERYIWHKLILNAAINPLGALLRLKNGDLAAAEPVRELMEDLVKESVAVARLGGILLPSTDYLAELRSLLAETRDNVCSMLQDVLRGRRTEVAQINGALGKLAEDYGLVHSVNQLVAGLVEATEQSYAVQIKKL